MADYYTQASFIIPCSPDIAGKAIHALKQINDRLTDIAKEAISKNDDASITEYQNVIRECYLNHPEYDERSTETEYCWDFIAEPCEEGIWVHYDESISTEHAAIFTHAVLKTFDLPHLVEIQAAHTCSRPKTDGFGGHACVVSKDIIRWGTYYDFIRSEETAHVNNEHYYHCTITEINGEYEYQGNFLMKCTDAECPDARLDDIFMNYRGEGNKDNDDVVVWYDSGLAAKNPVHQEITPYEYHIMKNHLVVL